MNYIYQDKKDYDKTYQIGEETFKYYSKRQFRKKYPKNQGGFLVVGTMGNGLSKEKGEFLLNGIVVPYYESKFNKFRFGLDGYLECGEDIFLEVIRPKLGKHVVELGMIMMLIFGIGICGNMLLNEQGPLIDKGAGAYELENKKVPGNKDENHIAIPGYGDIRMKAGSDKVNLVLYNPKNNPCYFKFIIRIKDTKEVIYESELVPPGQAIQEVTFKRAIEKGVYPSAIRIRSYDLKDYTKELNGGEINTNIIAIQ